MTRRELLGSGLALGRGGELAQPAIDARRLDELVDQLTAIAGQLRTLNDGCSTGVCPTGSKIRDAMVLFMRANGKFPDVMEVGPAVFLEMHDWHVRNRQTLTSVAAPTGATVSAICSPG